MRALTAGNKKRFAIFALIIITIIILLIFGLRLALNHEVEEYKIESNVTLYDSEYEPFESEETGIITKKWDGNYYLTLDNSKETYKLNSKVVSFNETNSKITLYGDVFKVLLDGQVEKYSKDTEIKSSTDDALYKIADRQYLIISNSIRNETGSISTSKYLYIILDKSGNTLLLNNQIYAKTINPIVLSTNSYKFDIANEKLIVGNDEIDLKKIIGSSNEYIEKDDNDEEEQQDTQEQIQSNKDNSEDTVADSSNSNPNIGGSVTNNQGGSTGTSSGTSVGDINGDGTVVGSGSTNKTPLSKSVSLRGAIATSSYIDIEYAVSDPENKYQTVYAFVEGSNYENMIALDKNSTTYRVTDLEPNTEYKITLGYKEITEENEIIDNIEDVLSVRTTKINATLDITKVATGSKKIYFNLKLDQNYSFDYAKVALYVDGVKENEIEVDIQEAVKTAGWSSLLKYETYGHEIALKVEGSLHDGSTISTNIQAKYRNY